MSGARPYRAAMDLRPSAPATVDGPTAAAPLLLSAPSLDGVGWELPGTFTVDRTDELVAFVRRWGFAVLRGVYAEEELTALEAAMERAQAALLAGELPSRCGTSVLDDPSAAVGGEPFAHYVCHITEVSDAALRAATAPPLVAVMRQVLGPQAWLLDDDRFGVVYQDARPGEETYYSRIGWHSDHQSGPTLDIWPSLAFTIHIDATSPANGFLRVVPGSHRIGTGAMPLGFEPVPGEVAVYAARGDVIFHDADLWHSAARATDDPPLGVRRHLRGGYYGGARLAPGHGVEDFVKNAAR